MRRWLCSLVLMLGLMSVLAGCASTKAATPGEQALLDASQALVTLSSSFVATSQSYTAKCGATPRQMSVADCNAFIGFSNSFKREYASAVDDWKQARASGSGQAAVAQRVDGLNAKLKPYADKAK